MIAKKRGKKEIYWANLINNYWTRFEKKAEKLKNNKNLINNNKSKGINKKQLKRKLSSIIIRQALLNLLYKTLQIHLHLKGNYYILIFKLFLSPND